MATDPDQMMAKVRMVAAMWLVDFLGLHWWIRVAAKARNERIRAPSRRNRDCCGKVRSWSLFTSGMVVRAARAMVSFERGRFSFFTHR